jgi:hypothetical protein
MSAVAFWEGVCDDEGTLAHPGALSIAPQEFTSRFLAARQRRSPHPSPTAPTSPSPAPPPAALSGSLAHGSDGGEAGVGGGRELEEGRGGGRGLGLGLVFPATAAGTAAAVAASGGGSSSSDRNILVQHDAGCGGGGGGGGEGGGETRDSRDGSEGMGGPEEDPDPDERDAVPLRPDPPGPLPPANSATTSSLSGRDDDADTAAVLRALLFGPAEAWGELACLRYEGFGRAEDLRVGDVADLLRQYQALAALVRRLACHTRQAAPASTPRCTQDTCTGLGGEEEQHGSEMGSSACGDRCAVASEGGGGEVVGGSIPGQTGPGRPTSAE